LRKGRLVSTRGESIEFRFRAEKVQHRLTTNLPKVLANL